MTYLHNHITLREFEQCSVCFWKSQTNNIAHRKGRQKKTHKKIGWLAGFWVYMFVRCFFFLTPRAHRVSHYHYQTIWGGHANLDVHRSACPALWQFLVYAGGNMIAGIYIYMYMPHGVLIKVLRAYKRRSRYYHAASACTSS